MNLLGMYFTEVLQILTILLAVIILILAAAIRRKKVTLDLSTVFLRFDALEKGQERLEKSLRDEIARNREEASAGSRQARGELTQSLTSFAGTLQRWMKEIAGFQKNQLDSFAKQLLMLTQTNEKRLEHMRATIEEKLSGVEEQTRHQMEEVRKAFDGAARAMREEMGANLKAQRIDTHHALKHFSDSAGSSIAQMASLLKGQMEAFSGQIQKLTAASENRLESVRTSVENRLKAIQEDNSRQLDQMRQTVDEKLQGTLEKRLGESFKQVSERLEQVHKGLGEMQTLATGVGDLKKALTNVKTRGGWGEIQLEALLEEILAPEQFERNVKTNEASGEVVEFAIRLPGREGGKDDPVWLPIDAKFPVEDYQRLVDAQEKGDAEAADASGKMLVTRIKGCAKDICDKYIRPPKTTDFALMFLPTEGLYAEVVRRPGLVETIQREFRVVIAGPTTLAALLNSLQMGFRTLAIQKRSSEVWKLLGAVKTEFGKFGEVLDGVKKKLEQASNTMDSAARRSRAIERKLRTVEALPQNEARMLIAGEERDADAL